MTLTIAAGIRTIICRCSLFILLIAMAVPVEGNDTVLILGQVLRKLLGGDDQVSNCVLWRSPSLDWSMPDSVIRESHQVLGLPVQLKFPDGGNGSSTQQQELNSRCNVLIAWDLEEFRNRGQELPRLSTAMILSGSQEYNLKDLIPMAKYNFPLISARAVSKGKNAKKRSD